MRHVRKTVTVNAPVSEVFRFWRDLENLPRFMHHLEYVEVSDDGRRSHWVAKGPAGLKAEWDAEIVEEKRDEKISWRSLPGSEVRNAGAVHFRKAPADRGTEIQVVLSYEPPAGRAGALVARLLGEEPEQQLREDLRRFKQVIETGEVVRSAGRRSSRLPDVPEEGGRL